MLDYVYRLSFLETKVYITPINWPWLRSVVQILMIESFGCNLIYEQTEISDRVERKTTC